MLLLAGQIRPASLCTSCMCVAFLSKGRFPPSLGSCCDSANTKNQTHACVCVCGREAGSEGHRGHSGRRSQLLVRSFFFPPEEPLRLCRTACSLQSASRGTQPSRMATGSASHGAADGRTFGNTQGTHVTVAIARCGTRTPVVSVK